MRRKVTCTLYWCGSRNINYGAAKCKLPLKSGTHQEKVFTCFSMHSTGKCIARTGGRERHASTHIQAKVSQHAQHDMRLQISFTCSGTDSGSVGAARRG